MCGALYYDFNHYNRLADFLGTDDFLPFNLTSYLLTICNDNCNLFAIYNIVSGL